MVFSSLEFLLYFLPAFLVVYGLTPARYRNVTLLLGSLIFYGLGEPRYLGVLAASVVVNYFIGLYLAPEGRCGRRRRYFKRALFIWAVMGNVGVLAFFKWASFGMGVPLGMSFYTFQVLAYLIDVYRGDVEREVSFQKFSAYIIMFPKLTSGPVTRYGQIKEGLDGRYFTVEGIQKGLKVFTMGLAAKVLLADRIGLLWNHVQTTGFESISTPLAWLGAVACSVNIYFDFYGYSLMAVGLGRMLGFALPENFKEPYMARSVRDFYRRWHVTLGSWFRRYVYIPLGGNRKGALRTVGNLFVVWVLTAMWHGTTLNFLIWGMLLFGCIVIERWLERFRIFGRMQLLPRLYLWTVIPVSWMCFGISQISQLKIYLGRMFGLTEGLNVNPDDWKRVLSDYRWLLAVCLLCCTPVVRKLFAYGKERIWGQVILGILFWVCVVQLLAVGDNPFLYFKF